MTTHGWARLDDLRVTTQGPFAVGSVVWRDVRGRLVCTVVAKATYKLAPVESAPLDVPLPIQEEDGHWDDDPSKSVHVPSDLVPYKTAAEIVVVGSAFAPDNRPAQSLTARVVVGSVDKSVEAWSRRRRRADGALEDGPSLLRFPLRYEYAAGGPGTDNPPGIELTRADTQGGFRIPQLLPPFHELGAPSDHVPTVSFGPIASTWPPRTAGLGPHELAWLRHPAASPLPQTFPARFFQAAPVDQWLDRPLAANERIVLERLDAAHPRLVMNLSGIEPRAIVVGASGEPLRLAADLLLVDTDRALATLTFRAPILIGEGARSLHIIVVGARMGAEISPASVRRMVEAGDEGERTASGGWRGSDDEITGAEGDAVLTTSAAPPPWAVHKPALPFGGRSTAPTQTRATQPDRVMPFRSAPPRTAPPEPVEPRATGQPPPHVPPAAPPPSRSEAPPVALAPDLAPPPPAPPALVPLTSISGAQPPAEVERAAARPSPSSLFELRAETPAPRPVAIDAPPAPARAASEASASFLAAFGGAAPKRPEASIAPAGFGAAFKGARAASDAAADDEGSREAARAQAPQRSASRAADAPPQRLAVVDLLHFEPRLAPRLRTMKAYAHLWTRPARARAPQGVDEPVRATPSADRDRADVLWVLSCGRAVDAAEIRAALAESLDDLDDLELPVVLVAGELRPIFDEVEALRAAISVAQPLSGADKKLLAAIAVAQEALAVPHTPRPETVLGLGRQIEQASLGLSLPPRFVAMEVERLLLESRKFKRRTLLGAPRVRADLILARSGEALPLYLPDAISASLPLLSSFSVVALCEVRPREDAAEPHAEALMTLALGRVVHRRAEA